MPASKFRAYSTPPGWARTFAIATRSCSAPSMPLAGPMRWPW